MAPCPKLPPTNMSKARPEAASARSDAHFFRVMGSHLQKEPGLEDRRERSVYAALEEV